MHDLKPSDILSRFLTKRGHINVQQRVVNSSVFSEKHPNGFSVFHTTGLSNAIIWGIANAHVIKDPAKPLLGRCDLDVAAYEQAKLDITKKEPPPKHYNVFGMPVSTDMEEASKLSMRQVLVSKAKLELVA